MSDLRWWLDTTGELHACQDHEFYARQLLRNESHEPTYCGRRAILDGMFSRGWLKLLATQNQLLFDGTTAPNMEQRAALEWLYIDLQLELYDVQKMRVDTTGLNF